MSHSNGLAVVQPSAPAPTPIRGPRLGLPTHDELALLREYGEIIVKSGMAPAHIKTAEAAIVVMRYGAQLGVDEFTALQNMYVIGGKPAAMAKLLHSLILRDHGGDAVQIVETNAERCVLRCKRRDTSNVTEVAYTYAEAEAAGLPKKNAVWLQYPADMLFARAISRAGRQVYMDSTLGMYVPEEIGGDVIEVAGEVISARVADDPTDFASTRGRRMPAEPPSNKLARLHAVGAERGLDHDALHRVTRFKLPQVESMAQLTEAMASDLAAELETAADADVKFWAIDWEQEIADAEQRGMDGLNDIAAAMRSNAITSKTHPWIAAAWQAAKRRVESAPPTGIIDADVTTLSGMPPSGDAGDDRYTA